MVEFEEAQKNIQVIKKHLPLRNQDFHQRKRQINGEGGFTMNKKVLRDVLVKILLICSNGCICLWVEWCSLCAVLPPYLILLYLLPEEHSILQEVSFQGHKALKLICCHWIQQRFAESNYFTRWRNPLIVHMLSREEINASNKLCFKKQ